LHHKMMTLKISIVKYIMEIHDTIAISFIYASKNLYRETREHVRLNSGNADGWPADYNLGSVKDETTTHLYRLLSGYVKLQRYLKVQERLEIIHAINKE